jgi:pimeloyl-ACP methyl ester carboxylesterase
LTVQVRRRLIIYVQGYDPRGLAGYYRMFRSEYRRTCELYGLAGDVGRPEDSPDAHAATWDVTTNGNGWAVETRYVFLRWEDIIRKDFARPAWLKIIKMFIAMVRSILNDVVPRCFMAHWRFGFFIIYPMMLMLFWMAVGAGFGIVCAKLVSALGAPLLAASVVGLVTGFGAFAFLLRATESQTYLLYMCDDIDASNQFSSGRRPDWRKRLDEFADYVVETVRNSDADEAIIVGHSSGSFLAVEVLDRALVSDPALGRHKPKLRLLTIGANLPIVGFNPRAQWFRDRIKRLAVAPDLDWVDYQSRHDIMNFWPFDPVTGHGIKLGPERRNPKVVAISFRDLWIPGDFSRRRWRFFKAHFQFLMANERRGAAYDYYLICCGPLDLLTRADKPEEAIAAMAA